MASITHLLVKLAVPVAALGLAACSGSGTGGAGGTGGTGGPGPNPGACSAQTFRVATYSSGFARNAAFAGGTIYYPADAPGPYGGVAIVPGFVSPVSMMASWGTYLASRGFAAILVDPPTALDLPPTRSRAQIAALQSLVGEATRAGSPLNGKLDAQKLGAGGWSMGGGGTMETANTSPPLPGLKGVFPLAPWNIGGIYSRTQVPSIVFAGTADILVPPSMARPEYDSIPAGTPKAYVEFQGADHFIFTNPNGGGGQLGSYTHAWLQVYLNGRTECKAAIGRGSGMSNFLSASL